MDPFGCRRTGFPWRRGYREHWFLKIPSKTCVLVAFPRYIRLYRQPPRADRPRPIRSSVDGSGVVVLNVKLSPNIRTVRQVATRGWRGWVFARRVHSPPFSRRGGCAVNKRSRSLAAQPGWFVNSNKIRCATRIFIRRLRDLLLTTPSAPLRNGTFLLRRSHPSLKTEGNELTSTAVIDFEIACLGQSPGNHTTMRTTIAHFELVNKA